MNVLLVEAGDEFAGAVEAALNLGGDAFHTERATTLEAAAARLVERAYDAVLLDLSLPDASGLPAFHAVRVRCPHTALLVLTSGFDADVGMQAVRRGAQDALTYTEVDARLGVTVKRAIERARAEQGRIEFFADVCHELRAPVSGIVGLADLLLDAEYASDPEHMRKHMQLIKESGEEALRLISEILDLSRLAAGETSVALSTVPIEDVLDDVLQAAVPLAQQCHLTLVAECACEIGTVRADRTSLRQALFNLVSNAIKYTPPGGHIELRCNNEERDVRFTVIDSGIGIAADERPYIFKPFYRSHHAIPYHGLPANGLGLTITKRLVEMQNGTIDFVSVRGKGSAFSITLRADDSAVA